MSKPCKRNSTVQRYQKYFKNCYYNEFNDLVEYKLDLPQTDMMWGNYWIEQSTDFRFTQASEYYKGNFGNYFPTSGYIQDFYPYDYSFAEYSALI